MSKSNLSLTVASIGYDGCHIVVVAIDGKEIHRDGFFVDRADDRRRFIDAVVAKLPAIQHGAVVSPEDIDAQLITLASKAPPAIDWQKPEPIGQPDLPAFPVDALPPVLANWVAEESEATQTPADMAALLALSVCAATLAKRVTVQAWAGWQEPTCNLYVTAILDPGNRKSAVFADATRPLREVEKKLREDCAEAIAEELSDYRQAEKRLAKCEKTAAEYRDAEKRREAKDEARELAKQLATWAKPEEPTLIVDNATSEALEMLLQANGNRMASMSAEGGIFDLMAGKYSKNGATDFNVYLMGHSGDVSTVHRVGRSRVNLDEPALTVGLAIQPEVIRGIAQTPAFRGRGLLGRFLYAIPKSWIGHRRIQTKPVSDVVTLAYSHVVKTLARFEPDEDGRPHRIKLSDDAVVAFHAFNEAIETELGSGSLELMRDWGSKLGGATLRIAAIIHCAGHVGEAGLDHDIDVVTIEAAQRIARWAIPHAAAALNLLAASDDEARDDAEYLLRWLRNDRPTEPMFDRRDAQRHGHRRFTGQPTRLDAALDLLESTNYIAKLNGPKIGGRVTYAVSLHVAGDKPNRQTRSGGDNGDNQAPEPPPEPSSSPLSPGLGESKRERVKVTL